MTISERDWNNYIQRLAKLDKRAGDAMEQYISRYGTGDTEALISYANALVTKYGEGSAELAAQMYDEMAQAAGANVSPAEPAEPPSMTEVAKAVYSTLSSPPSMKGAVSRMVKQAGADTTLKNALRDGAEFAWVPGGTGCAFCLTLASRGWQKASKKAIKGGHAQHIHANCKCNYAIRFDSRTNVAGYDPDKYLQMYENAEGDTPDEKINAMRRAQYQEKKDEINAQKREAYRARKADYMGAPKPFGDRSGVIAVKAYRVKGHDTLFTQTYSTDAQGTISLVLDQMEQIPQLQSVPEIVVAKDIPGIAAYDHTDNRLYLNEQLSNAEYIKEQLSDGYFVAENAEDVLKHEMHHKEHWDYIEKAALTSGKSRDMVKQETEAELREYVNRQLASDRQYIRKTISSNASDAYLNASTLNELIADALLQADKGISTDTEIQKLVRGCVE